LNYRRKAMRTQEDGIINVIKITATTIASISAENLR
jgi:hypothetical protein